MFSRQNSDAVLAASIMLSLQVTDWYVLTLASRNGAPRFTGAAAAADPRRRQACVEISLIGHLERD